ncbi:nucleoside 2-deoxyribosyltransferase [Acidithiobacillus sp.]|uniref:nucleoside 2-deoxyribosyltransferase n=1 Tax=Acidithiobacillus sp. TaxID=1872118 RepID=UPI0026314ACC|nr:nucleoside 2-deoxyribosyltransferase [Acidithiobacillus sp.]MDD5278608.1 nucleoside 2-deoxyribosyltransferase [Acidithiobacillus sp.]
MTHKVYIAGPDVFRQDWPKFTTSVCACFEGHENFAPVFPIPPDQSLDRPDLPGSTLQGTRADAFPVSDRCIDLINDCEFVLANISPFRGEEPDSGTVVEIVRAHLMGKIVVAYTNRLPPNIDPDIYQNAPQCSACNRAVVQGVVKRRYRPQGDHFGLLACNRV